MTPRKRQPPGRSAERALGATWYSRQFVAVLEGGGEPRKISRGRAYFRERRALSFHVRTGRADGVVQGTQLDPFNVTISSRAVDPETVVALLKSQSRTNDLIAVARGDLTRQLGELVMPTESADLLAECSCPDDSGRCIHAYVLGYEVAAQMDSDPTVLLSFMGAKLASLLGHLNADTQGSDSESGGGPGATTIGAARAEPALVSDFYGDHMAFPEFPMPAPIDVFDELDPAVLRLAVRRSGARAADVTAAVEELAELYRRIRGGAAQQ